MLGWRALFSGDDWAEVKSCAVLCCDAISMKIMSISVSILFYLYSLSSLTKMSVRLCIYIPPPFFHSPFLLSRYYYLAFFIYLSVTLYSTVQYSRSATTTSTISTITITSA